MVAAVVVGKPGINEAQGGHTAGKGAAADNGDVLKGVAMTGRVQPDATVAPEMDVDPRVLALIHGVLKNAEIVFNKPNIKQNRDLWSVTGAMTDKPVNVCQRDAWIIGQVGEHNPHYYLELLRFGMSQDLADTLQKMNLLNAKGNLRLEGPDVQLDLAEIFELALDSSVDPFIVRPDKP
jgi:hypothetical protein